MCATTALVDSAVRRKQSSQPSRQPSSSLPTPAHRATSFGNVMGLPFIGGALCCARPKLIRTSSPYPNRIHPRIPRHRGRSGLCICRTGSGSICRVGLKRRRSGRWGRPFVAPSRRVAICLGSSCRFLRDEAITRQKHGQSGQALLRDAGLGYGFGVVGTSDFHGRGVEEAIGQPAGFGAQATDPLPAIAGVPWAVASASLRR